MAAAEGLAVMAGGRVTTTTPLGSEEDVDGDEEVSVVPIVDVGAAVGAGDESAAVDHGRAADGYACSPPPLPPLDEDEPESAEFESEPVVDVEPEVGSEPEPDDDEGVDEDDPVPLAESPPEDGVDEDAGVPSLSSPTVVVVVVVDGHE